MAFALNVILLPTNSAGNHLALSPSQVESLVTKNLDTTAYREVRVQIISDQSGEHHLLVHLHAMGSHSVRFAAIFLDDKGNALRVVNPYDLTDEDRAQQPGSPSVTCPDPTVQFIAFCPNDVPVEQQVTKDVAQSARAHGLKTVELLIKDATRQNYLNYMSCPNLKGNFYDGDSNATEFITVDGVISATDMKSVHFNYMVTNIWLACEAFNDPMLTAVITDAQSQKYAAGLNDLQIGPSDNTGKCAMIAAIDGQPMTQAFHACYTQYDVSADQWGFGGKGADLFGHPPAGISASW